MEKQQLDQPALALAIAGRTVGLAGAGGYILAEKDLKAFCRHKTDFLNVKKNGFFHPAMVFMPLLHSWLNPQIDISFSFSHGN